MQPIIEVKKLSKSFGSVTVLSEIDARIMPQEVVVVIGPSGSGKSTFLRCLNLLEVPEHGDISIEGQSLMDKNTNITEMRAEVGMVFQQFNLFPHMKVLDNITLAPLRVRKWAPDKARAKAMERSARSAWRTRRICILPLCLAVRRSAWPLPVRWRWSRR